MFRRQLTTPASLLVAPTLAAVIALAIAGCAGSDDTASPPPVTFATDAATTPGMTGMSAMPAMPNMPVVSSAPVQTAAGPNAIDINNFAFAPMTLTIPVGATVTWTNRDEEPHTVVADDGSFHSPGMDTGGTYSFTFTNTGSFDYVCSIHPFMHGNVVVTK